MNGRKRFESSKESAAGVVEQTRHQVAEAGRRAKQVVDDYPASTTFLAFGAGLATGLALVALIHHERRAWYEDYLPALGPVAQLRQYLPGGSACHR